MPPSSICPAWWGLVGVVATTPPHTSASAVVPVLSSPTNVTASPHTTSYAAPVILFVWVLPVSITFVTFPLSSIGSPISASVKLSFPQKVEVDPANTEVADHVLQTMYLQERA